MITSEELLVKVSRTKVRMLDNTLLISDKVGYCYKAHTFSSS